MERPASDNCKSAGSAFGGSNPSLATKPQPSTAGDLLSIKEFIDGDYVN